MIKTIIICLGMISLVGTAAVWLRYKYHPKYWNRHCSTNGFTIGDICNIRASHLIDKEEYKKLYNNVCQKGMTLIELLVSISILTIIILLFSTIISQSQELVSASTKTMRGNSEISAVVSVIRNDLRSITKQGFLCITETNGSPVMFFTKVGPTQSLTSPIRSNATCVSYGMVPNQAVGATDSILWRQGWILRDMGGSPVPQDIWDRDLASLQDCSIANQHRIFSNAGITCPQPDNHIRINELIFAIPSTIPADSSAIKIPAQTLTEINALWQCLINNSNSLQITWSNGDQDASQNIIWYGKDIPNGDINIENLPPKPYRALWSNHNQNNWPKMIKIKFEHKDVIQEVIAFLP